MNFQLLLVLPALAAIIWALVVKIKAKDVFESAAIFVSGVAVILNGLVVTYIVRHGAAPATLYFIQQLLSSAIVPLAYMYFSRQMGRQWNNVTAVFCWTLMILVFLPNINIIIRDGSMIDPAFVKPFTVNIIKGSAPIFTCHIADFVIILQAFLTVARMIPAGITLRKYGLKLSHKMQAFYLWWASAVLFIVFTSTISTADLCTPLGSWTYFILYTLLICSIFSLLALRFDLHMVVTSDEGDVVTSVDDFIDANKEMAVQLKRLLEEDQVYIQQGYTSDDAAKALATNRTYFSRMVHAEFGVKFSDLVTEYRVKKAKELLETTDKSIADIAFETGFSDSSYMNKKFQHIEGCSPSTYRDNLSK